MNIKLMMALPFVVTACVETSQPISKPVSPPAGASSKEVIKFFSDVCTQKGIPNITVKEAAAQGNVKKAFAHQACIDEHVIKHIRQKHASS